MDLRPKTDAEKARDQQLQQIAEARRGELMALAAVLGADDKSRSVDQRIVWEYLTRDMWAKSSSLDPVAMHVFEGKRQRAVELAIAVEESKRPKA